MPKRQFNKQIVDYNKLVKESEMTRDYLLSMLDPIDLKFRGFSDQPTPEQICEIGQIIKELEEIKVAIVENYMPR